MKAWQFLSFGVAAVALGGCAGYSAYVADAGGTSGGTSGSGCANLGYSGSSTISVDLNDLTAEDSGGLFFAVQALQGREALSDSVTVSFSNLPIGLTGSASPNPVTVSSSSPTPFTMNFTIDQDAIDVGIYNSKVVASRNGCSDTDFDVMVEVFDGNVEFN